MLGIIAATYDESKYIISFIENIERIIIDNIVFHVGSIGENDVVLAISKIGQINSAMTTTIMLKSFDISHVINIGISGGLKSELSILDIVIGTSCVQYDLNISLMDQPKVFYIDEYYIKAIKEIEKNFKNKTHYGLIATGDKFIRNKDVDYILNKYPEANCCDMEACSIAMVCWNMNVPFIVVKVISDTPRNGIIDKDYLKIMDDSAMVSASLIEKIVKLF